MAQSKKYTIQIERVLKEYPYICWRINNQQSSLNKELKQMGIRKESIEFLKNAGVWVLKEEAYDEQMGIVW